MLKRLLFVTAACALHAEASKLETISVYASRLNMSAQPATLLTEKDLEIRKAYHNADALRGLPGITISQAGNRGGLTQVRVRGAEANHVKVIMDGIELNNPGFGDEYGFGHLDLTGVNAVELINGPQSSIWGSDALAGLIYIDSSPVGNISRIDIAGGSHTTRDASFTVSRLSEAGHFSSTASHFSTAGTNISRQGEEDDAYSNTTLHLNVLRKINELTIEFVVRNVSAEVEFDPVPSPKFVPADGNRITKSRQRYAKIETRFEGFDIWLPHLSVTSSRVHDHNNSDGKLSTATLGEKATITFSNNFVLNPKHHLNLSIEHEHERFDQRGPPTFYGNPNQTQALVTRSVSLEHQFRGNWARTGLSVRYDDIEQFNNSISYHAGIILRIGPGDVFGSVGTGIKTPTFTERYGFSPNNFFGNPKLKPEESFEYQTGYVTKHFSITYFDSTLDNEIDGYVFDPWLRGFTAKNRETISNRRGIEVTYHNKIGLVTVTASYSFVESLEANLEELRRPRNQFRLDLHGYLTKSLRFSMGIQGVGKQQDNDFSTVPATRRTLKRYSLIHGGLDMKIASRIRIYGNVENLLNKDYQDLFGYRNPGLRAIAGVSIDL